MQATQAGKTYDAHSYSFWFLGWKQILWELDEAHSSNTCKWVLSFNLKFHTLLQLLFWFSCFFFFFLLLAINYGFYYSKTFKMLRHLFASLRLSTYNWHGLTYLKDFCFCMLATKSWPADPALIGRLPAGCQTSLQINAKSNRKTKNPERETVEFFHPTAFTWCPMQMILDYANIYIIFLAIG